MDLEASLNIKSLNKLVMFFLFLMVLLVFSLTVYYARYGFDFTDEGFYINSISYPGLYNQNISLFGFIYHLLFNLFGKNWLLLREINIIIIYLLCFMLTFNSLKILDPIFKNNFKETLIFSFALATSSFLYLTTFNWLVSPSYNSLNFIGFLITSIGLLKFDQNTHEKINYNLIIIAFGGYLVFMAKLSSLLSLAILSLIYLICSNKVSLKNIFLVAIYFCFFVFVTVLIIDHSFYLFFLRLKHGLDNYHILVDNTIFRIDMNFSSQTHKKILYNLIYLWIIFFLYLRFFSRNNFLKITIILLISLAFIKDGFKILLDFKEIDFIYFPVLALFTLILDSTIQKNFRIHKNISLLGIYFFILPYAFAFGTSNPYWYQSQMVAYFWILSAICFLSCLTFSNNQFKILLYSLSFLTIFFTTLLIFKAIKSPYRQESILKTNQLTKLSINNDKFIYVPDSINNCILNLRHKVKKSIKNDYFNLIDLTGRSPGLIFLIDGIPIGAPWLMGGYENSNKFLNVQLKNILNKKQNYILLSGSIYDKNNIEMLSDLNIDLKNKYFEIINQECDVFFGEETHITYRIFQYQEGKR